MELKNCNYPAFFYYDEDGISIEFPDLPGCLPCAATTEEAFKNAKEALGVHLFGLERDGDEIPAPSPTKDLHPEEGATLVMIEVSMPLVRARLNNQYVKKTLTIPSWLNIAAEEANINFSQLLQEGLKARLGY